MTKTNRDYTGLERTPSSMAWLIRKRGVAKGQLDKCKKQLAELPDRILSLEAEINALDMVIPLHEVKVDPTIITGRRTLAPRIAPNGALTAFLLRTLKECAGEPVNSRVLTHNFMLEQSMEMTKANLNRAGQAVKNRLKNLEKEKVAVRHHAPKSNDFGIWSLHPNLLQN